MTMVQNVYNQTIKARFLVGVDEEQQNAVRSEYERRRNVLSAIRGEIGTSYHNCHIFTGDILTDAVLYVAGRKGKKLLKENWPVSFEVYDENSPKMSFRLDPSIHKRITEASEYWKCKLPEAVYHIFNIYFSRHKSS